MKLDSEREGFRVQCVEFARNWLSQNMNIVFNEVDIAADIWSKISFYTHLADGRQLCVSGILNGAQQPPKIGDLIIYGQEFLTTGHVAVTTEVNLKTSIISVREQNFKNQYQAPDHVRNIPLIINDNRYWLLDKYIIGWKQIKEIEK